MKRLFLLLLFVIVNVSIYSENRSSITLPTNATIEAVNTFGENVIIRYLIKETGLLSEITSEYVWCNGNTFGPFLPYYEDYFALEGIIRNYQHFASFSSRGNFYAFAAKDKSGYCLIANNNVIRCINAITNVALSNDGKTLFYIEQTEDDSFIAHVNQKTYLVGTKEQYPYIGIVNNSLNTNRIILETINSNNKQYYEIKDGTVANIPDIEDIYINDTGEIIVSVVNDNNKKYAKVGKETIGPYDTIHLLGISLDGKKIIYSTIKDGIEVLHCEDGDLILEKFDTLKGWVAANDSKGVAYAIGNTNSYLIDFYFNSHKYGPFCADNISFFINSTQILFSSNSIYYIGQDIKTKKDVLYENDRPISDPYFDMIFGIHKNNTVFYFYMDDNFNVLFSLNGVTYPTVAEMVYYPPK